MSDRSPTKTDPLLAHDERVALAELVRSRGEETVRVHLGIGKLALARLLAGLPVLRSTIYVARDGMRTLIRGIGR
jgi:hypothetical protein